MTMLNVKFRAFIFFRIDESINDAPTIISLNHNH